MEYILELEKYLRMTRSFYFFTTELFELDDPFDERGVKIWFYET